MVPGGVGERNRSGGEEANGAGLSKLWDLDQMVDISWRQKSRALWLKVGHKNIEFFHLMANIRKRGLIISAKILTT